MSAGDLSRIFRACDIRGLYPDEVSEDLFYRIGAVLGSSHVKGGTALIGRDGRDGAEPLRSALVSGLLATGAHVLDAGIVPTPVVYFGARRLVPAVTAIVTASHNAPEYCGLKLLIGRWPAGRYHIDALSRNIGVQPGSPDASGSYATVDLAQEYVEFLASRWSDVGSPADRSLRHIIDPGNGTWAGLALRIFRRIGLETEAINDYLDGKFAARSPDCAAPGSMDRVAERVRESGACAGVAWDGDGDRVAFTDERGTAISSDQIAMILLPYVLAAHPGARVVMDVKMSMRVSELIRHHGGTPVFEKSAHCALERRMIVADCEFGCEYSGHFFFRELRGADDGIFAALSVLRILRSSGLRMSELVAGVPGLYITPDIRVNGGPEEFRCIGRRIESEFASGDTDRLDGYKVRIGRGWFLVRPSVSEHKLSFRVEGDTPEALARATEAALRVVPNRYADALIAGLPLSVEHSLQLYKQYRDPLAGDCVDRK